MNWITRTAAIVALALAAGQAGAHSKKEATTPADGAALSASPQVITMTFDMPLRVTLISLTDQDGTNHALTRSDDMRPVSDFSAQPPVLPAGLYTVTWRGLADDGHPMQGTFSFEVAS
jgi:methionine-rich copper-binding protein CopC